jgi:hypothetical protein
LDLLKDKDDVSTEVKKAISDATEKLEKLQENRNKILVDNNLISVIPEKVDRIEFNTTLKNAIKLKDKYVPDAEPKDSKGKLDLSTNRLDDVVKSKRTDELKTMVDIIYESVNNKTVNDKLKDAIKLKDKYVPDAEPKDSKGKLDLSTNRLDDVVKDKRSDELKTMVNMGAEVVSNNNDKYLFELLSKIND